MTCSGSWREEGPDLAILSPTRSDKLSTAVRASAEQAGRGAVSAASVSHQHGFD